MKHKKLLSLVLAAMVIASLILTGCVKPAAPPEKPVDGVAPTPAPEEEVFKWRMQIGWPAGSVADQGEFLAQDIMTMSGGRIDIEVFPSGAICPSYQLFEVVDSGVLDACWAGAMWTGVVSGVDAANYRPGFTTLGFIFWHYQWGGKEVTEHLYAGTNVIPILAGQYGPELLLHSNKPIDTLDDLKGMKIRIGTVVPIRTYEKLGVNAVSIPGGEIYSALERGVIDATEYSIPSLNWAVGLQEITEYIYAPGFHMPQAANYLLVNKDVWEALPTDLKAIVEVAADKRVLDSWLTLTKADMEAIEKFEKYGTKIRRISPEIMAAWKAAYEEVIAEIRVEDPAYDGVLSSIELFEAEWETYRDLYDFGALICPRE